MFSYHNAIKLKVDKKKNLRILYIWKFNIPLLNNWKFEKEIIMKMLKCSGENITYQNLVDYS